jgi:uncharacterized protein (TIGR02246 family)
MSSEGSHHRPRFKNEGEVWALADHDNRRLCAGWFVFASSTNQVALEFCSSSNRETRRRSAMNDEQAIGELVATWLAASKAGDTQKVLSLMADDVVFLVAGHPPMRGKATFAASQAAIKEFDLDATSEIQEVRVFGEWAYLWTALTVVMTPKKGGTPVRRAGPTLSILQKQPGGWVIVRDANMLAGV